MEIEQRPQTQKVERTSLRVGDIVLIWLIKGDCPVVTINRHAENRLLFESNGSHEKAFTNLPTNYYACRSIIELICEISGLQALEVDSNERFVKFEMQAGQSVFAGERTFQ